eukprot:TRINITY_DN11866_c0_g1_i3.p2 TRINITY_DN11866_c0_g1~~TRINITY_DN11866_c0_g1_i3.p2  ORF type:complete len:126 (+),score=14.87 TRINITY_DN11866_c0_g1_i3:278-655(+)
MKQSSGSASSVDAGVRALQVLKHCSSTPEYISAVRALHKMATNLLKPALSPEEKAKFREVFPENKAFHSRVGRLPGGIEVLVALGFTLVDSEPPRLVLEAVNESEEMISRLGTLLGSIAESAATP